MANYTASTESIWSYRAYGLRIESFIELPELEEWDKSFSSDGSSATSSDVVTVMLDPIVAYKGEVPAGKLMHGEVDESSAMIFYPKVATYRIDNGNVIRVAPEPDVAPSTLKLFLVNSALAILLHHRGWTSLHGSAVEINGSACIFLGGSGWGKSTICASLYARGYRSITDDVAVVRPDGSADHRHIVLPAFPRIKVWPDTAKLLGVDPSGLPIVQPEIDKRILRTDQFVEAPVPLKRIYILAKGDSIAIEDIAPSQAVIEFVLHAFNGNFLKDINPDHHFLQYVHLARHVTVKKLTRPWNLDLLPDVIKEIESDMMYNEPESQTA